MLPPDIRLDLSVGCVKVVNHPCGVRRFRVAVKEGAYRGGVVDKVDDVPAV